jgi:hypothetical protein
MITNKDFTKDFKTTLPPSGSRAVSEMLLDTGVTGQLCLGHLHTYTLRDAMLELSKGVKVACLLSDQMFIHASLEEEETFNIWFWDYCIARVRGNDIFVDVSFYTQELKDYLKRTSQFNFNIKEA